MGKRMVRIRIHEDDEGVRNLYPLAALAEAEADVESARRHGEEHRAPGGAGWRKAYAIEEPAVTYRSLNLKAADVAAALAGVLPRVDEFEVGFGAGNPFHRLDLDPQCYGFGPELYVKLETDGEYLAHIWFDVRWAEPEKIAALRRALEAVERVVPSAVADY